MKALLRRLRTRALSPPVRIGMGLSSIVVTILLVTDFAFGVLPDQSGLLRELRQRISENLAIQTAALLEAGEVATLDHVFQEQLRREKSLLSIAVRRDDGRLIAEAGDHAEVWREPAQGESQLDYVQVPLHMAQQRWGEVEVSFEHASPRTVLEWLRHPAVLLFLALGGGSFMIFVLYLRRVLLHLDPSTVIPERVRSAFDVFSGGVMILDTHGRVMLVNAALETWMGPANAANLIGRNVATIPWFSATLPADRAQHPWQRAMTQGSPQDHTPFEFRDSTDTALTVIANCAPILDGGKQVRGCLVTFDNVTHLEKLNAQLLTSMAELNLMKDEIERKNAELQRLATRDPLTGCLNRRALHAELDALVSASQGAEAPGGALCCVMTDIDHFKAFNDQYGHVIGDRVLQATAQKLNGALREEDLLARYGGEEFCILLPGVALEQACAVAERLRRDVEEQAGAAIRTTRGLKVTASFGVAAFEPGVSAAQLIDRADQALYAAKNAGRNCVKVFARQAAAA